MRLEVVAPVDVTAQLHLQLAQRREPLPVDEFRLQDLIGRLVHCVVVGGNPSWRAGYLCGKSFVTVLG